MWRSASGWYGRSNASWPRTTPGRSGFTRPPRIAGSRSLRGLLQWSTASTTTRASKISGSTTDSISSHGPLCDFDKRKGGNGNSAPTLRRWAASALLIAISGCGTAFAQNARRDFADARGQPGEYKLDHGGRSRRPTKVSASRQYWVDAG